ncbi:phosphate ABC transporter permease [Pleurocapsales cyanobacterium LEGE 10410]|nr:phosphate ABC transporter permease [Pleurocapsales cyanobacterium LEGE 10410]
MLKPLTREKMEQLIPLIATGQQYRYYWGKWSDLLNRLLISVVGIVVILILDLLFGDQGEALILLLGGVASLYWLWCPVYQASIRNAANRRFKYAGFWRGRVLEVFLTEELIGEEETVNQRGELVIVENRERWINLVLGDKTGFEVDVQAPLQRIYKGIKPGQTAELLVMSNQPDLGRINKISDAYIPSQNLWVGQYPYIQRDVFVEVSRQLGGMTPNRARRRSPNRNIKRRDR